MDYSLHIEKPIWLRRFLDVSNIEILLAYHYPGNVRELENVLEYAFILIKGRTIRAAHLPSYLLEAKSAANPGPLSVLTSQGKKEMDTILAALQENRWNKGRTAKALGISRTTLWRRMKQYRLIHGIW